jgi:DnaJ-class molecular chaperone
MAAPDHYETLGVPRTASADEIRRAYRKLARQYHPDVNKAKDAQATFTKVQEAYDTLADEQKRKRYDRYGSADPAPASTSARPHYSWSNVGNGAGAGFDQTELDPETLGSMFEAFFGGRADEANMGRRPRSRAAARGADVEAELEVPFLTAARGGTERFRVQGAGKGKTIDVKIPKGIADGAKLRIKGAGEPGPKNQTGDLILTIRVGAHPLLKREPAGPEGAALDLSLELPLTIVEATLGAKVSVPTLQGKVELTIPPGTSSGRRFRLRGFGVEDEQGRKGDLYATARIVAPAASDLKPDDHEHLRSMADRIANPRTGDAWGAI